MLFLGCVIVAILCPFLWFRNVIDTVVALLYNCESLCCNNSFLAKNYTSLKHNLFVFPGYGTFVYSHDLRAEKIAPATSCPIASSRAVVLDSHRALKTLTGSVFCDFRLCLRCCMSCIVA